MYKCVSSMDTYCRNFEKKKCEPDEKNRPCLDLYKERSDGIVDREQYVSSLIHSIAGLI